MSFLGVHLTLLIGPTVPLPAPMLLAEALEEAKVTHSDSGRSGFQLTFRTGRSGPRDLLDFPLLRLPQLKAFSRVVLVVTFGVVPRVISDGIITHSELQPGERPGEAKVVVTGEDVSVMMDLHERSEQHPAQDETIIANKLILKYAKFGLLPMVIPPKVVDPPIPIDRVPVQQGTDLAYIEQMAERHGHVFYVRPGLVPMTNVAYWGPPIRVGVPQRALTVNMGPAETNATLGAFQHNALAPAKIEGKVQDRTTNRKLPVKTVGPLRPPLAAKPAWLTALSNARTRQFRDPGLNASQSFGRAQGATDAAADAVTVDGELDAACYGDILRARALVGVRGAGYLNDGLWYVSKVGHELRPGSYKQTFSLAREGDGSTTPLVWT